MVTDRLIRPAFRNGIDLSSRSAAHRHYIGMWGGGGNDCFALSCNLPFTTCGASRLFRVSTACRVQKSSGPKDRRTRGKCVGINEFSDRSSIRWNFALKFH